MLPESLRRYAPQVRGTAATAARAVISQNGRKIREGECRPGPFVIDDLYDSACARSDLDVQVFEADGGVSSFSVPFASVPESMRPGLSRSASPWARRQYGDGDDLFADFTYSAA